MLNPKYYCLRSWDFNKNNEKNIQLLLDLNNDIKKYYNENIKFVNGESKDINVSDILSSKIILGVYGCIPAYDRYFISGLKIYDKEKEEKFGYTINKKSIQNLIKFYKENKEIIDKISQKKKIINGINYPIMKIIDMYFWQIGFEKDIKESKKF